MRQIPAAAAALILFAGAAAAASQAPTLDIYYIDTEGGQATLFVSPNKQTVLVDTGFAGARDPERILQALHAASASQIDFLIITHYHGDHVGGFAELASRIPIMNFVDHGPSVETAPPTPSKLAYDAAAGKAPHIIAGVGHKLPIRGINWIIVTSAGKVLGTDILGAPGAGVPNAYCAGFTPKDIQAGPENGQSVGSLVEYGKFRTVDLGDLLWNKEAELMCPTNHIGTIDLLLTSHHGMSWSGSQVLVHGLRPRVAIMNNGVSKGGEVEAFEMLETSPGLENLWQLHWSANGLLEHNVAGRFIANVESGRTTADIIANPPAPIVSATGPSPPPAGQPGAAPKPPPLGNPDHSPAYWIKVSARPDGTFSVTNSRNGFTKTYVRRD
jgi:beta-lactamase superfamily II metal-dependent hydrolase